MTEQRDNNSEKRFIEDSINPNVHDTTPDVLADAIAWRNQQLFSQWMEQYGSWEAYMRAHDVKPDGD